MCWLRYGRGGQCRGCRRLCAGRRTPSLGAAAAGLLLPTLRHAAGPHTAASPAQVLERIVPILGRVELAHVHAELAEAISRLLALAAAAGGSLFADMASGFVVLLQGKCGLQGAAPPPAAVMPSLHCPPYTHA